MEGCPGGCPCDSWYCHYDTSCDTSTPFTTTTTTPTPTTTDDTTIDLTYKDWNTQGFDIKYQSGVPDMIWQLIVRDLKWIKDELLLTS